MLTAIKGNNNSGWIAVDDFIFLPDVEDCSTYPPEADPNHSSTTVSGETTHIPPSTSFLLLFILTYFYISNFSNHL